MKIELPNREMPITYQAEDASLALNTVRAGEPCHIVGLGSIGKSNFLRHISRAEVKQYHLRNLDQPDEHEKLITVLLDSHNLLTLRGQALEKSGNLWPGYELMLSRLYRSLWALEMKGQSSAELTSLMTRLKDRHKKIFSANPTLAQSGLRSLEKSIYEILNCDSAFHIVFLMDDMEAFRQKLPDEFFVSLRGLRDDYKGKVIYLTTARTEMFEVMYKEASDRDSMEAFAELFHDHTFYIRPLSRQDVDVLLERLINRNRYEPFISETVRVNLANDLYNLTGGHSGLVRSCFSPGVRYHFSIVQRRQQASFENLKNIMISDEGVKTECSIIMNSFSTGEQAVIKSLISGRAIDNDHFWDLQNLVRKHIISPDETQFKIPLLFYYITASNSSSS